MNSIKMLVLDIDGTILKKDYTASEKTKKALKTLTQDGIKVVLCTGRMYAATKSIAEKFELKTPIISYQGGLIKNYYKNSNTLLEKTITEEQAREIINQLRTDNVFFNVYNNDVLMVEKDNELIQEYATKRFINYEIINNFDNIKLDCVNKILAIDNNPTLIENLQKKLSDKYSDKLYVIRSTPHFCEISNKNATKGNAVRFLANMWNIKKEEIMACGDQDNDIEMLLASGTKIAMGNASQGLKDIADFITTSVDEDGVVVAINKFIGEKYGL